MTKKIAPKLDVGDIVVSDSAPTELFRVTSKIGREALRLLPYQRSGREKVIMSERGGWSDGASWWRTI